MHFGLLNNDYLWVMDETRFMGFRIQPSFLTSNYRRNSLPQRLDWDSNGELPNAALRENRNAWNCDSSTCRGHISSVQSVKLRVESATPSKDADGI